MAGRIQDQIHAAQPAQQNSGGQHAAKQTINALLNSMLDSEGYRKRFDDLLGKRAPQFISSIISVVNADPSLQKAFAQSPLTVIQAALKAATYDLPIDPGLGYAYIAAFCNSKKQDDGTWKKVYEAVFLMGYKGMVQLAQRTSAYKTINVIDVRQGELRSFNRLTEEIDIVFIEDEEVREKTPIIGWVGYFKLINGAEKTVYMTRKQIEAHEQKHRKSATMTKGWREDFNSMAEKTILRRLIGKWGLMSIDYQRASESAISAAEALIKGDYDDEDKIVTEEYEVTEEHNEEPKAIEQVDTIDDLFGVTNAEYQKMYQS